MGSSGGGGGGGGGGKAGAVQGGLGAILSTAEGAQQDFKTAIANIQNIQRYNEGFGVMDAMGPYRTAQNQTAADWQARLQDNLTSANASWDDIIRDSQREQAGISGLMGDRYKRNMSYLEGAGTQERRDINQAFDNQNATATGNLISRGMASSTLAPTINAGIQRERSDAIGGLEERIRQQRIGTDSALSADWINQLAGGAARDASLRQQGWTNMQSVFGSTFANDWMLSQVPMQGVEGDMTRRLNWIGSRNDVAPDPSQVISLANNLGAAAAPTPRAPSAPSPWWGLGGQLGGTALLGADLALMGLV